MSVLQRLSGGLAQTLRLASRQFAAHQQGAAFHLSATLDARRKGPKPGSDSDSDSDDEKEKGNPSYRVQPQEAQSEGDWDVPFDASYVRNPDGSMPDAPMSALVGDNNGKFDAYAIISPALAAALEAAPADEEGEAAVLEQLHDIAERLEKGQRPKDDQQATEADLRLVAEAIDLYFTAVPGVDPDSYLEEFDRTTLEALGETIKEVLDGGARTTKISMAPPGRLPWEVLDVEDEVPMVNWGVDLTEAKADDPWKNALLSEEAKEEMWAMHSKRGWSAERLAAHFSIRQQRAMAILALKEREHRAREAGLTLHTDLSEALEEEFQAHEVMGASERHHVVLPSFPNLRELTEDDADKLAALLEKRLGKKFDDIDLEDMTPELTQELLAAAGMDKEVLEEELAQKEEEHLVAEFRRNLEYNLGKAGAGLSRSSRRTHPPKRPEAGWSLLVQPLGKAARSGSRQPYVATPDGSQRELNADELLLIERQTPRPRSKIL